MASAGMDRESGRLLTNFDHVAQSVGKVLTTQITERIMREWFGFPGFAMLGENMNRRNLARFLQLIAIALTKRQLNGLPAEPRFRVIKVTPLVVGRDGAFECRLEGLYLPRGHLGDERTERELAIGVNRSHDGFTAKVL